jgi:outer membrane protein assembly factor BamB
MAGTVQRPVELAVAPAGPIVQQPAIRDGRMYVVTEDGLHAVKIAGDHLWQFNRKRLGAPALGSETVVVTRAGQMLIILDALTGDLVHRGSMDGLPRTWAPLVSQDLVLFCGYHNGGWRSAALHAQSGERVWSHDGEYLGDRPMTEPPPAIVDALHVSADTNLPHGAAEVRRNLQQCLEPDEVLHEAAEDEGFELGVTTSLDRYRLLAQLGDTHVVTDHRTLWGVRLNVPVLTPPDEPAAPLSTLRERWLAQLEGHGPGLTASMSPIGLSATYVAVAAGLRVIALERTSGALRWSSDIVSTSVHCAGPVCLSIYAGHIHAIDAIDGATFWERRFAAEIAHVTHDERSLFIVTEDGGASCLDAASGRIRWSANGNSRNPLVIHDDELEREELDAEDLAWASRLVDGRFQWRSPDGVIRAADVATGADAVVVEEAHLISNGWVDEWLDTEQSSWRYQRVFQDGAVRLLTTGPGWYADHRGALVIRRGGDEFLHHLQPGWQYDLAALAADGAAVVMLAERQGDYLYDEEADTEGNEDPDSGQQWLLSVWLDEEAGVVVEHGRADRSDVSYDDLAVESVPRDLAAHHPSADSFDDVVAEPTLTVWLFEGDIGVARLR